ICSPPTPTGTYPLSLHDALPIFARRVLALARPGGGEGGGGGQGGDPGGERDREPGGTTRIEDVEQRGGDQQACAQQAEHGLALRSEEHTSELQSRENLVCRLLLE